MEDSEILTLFQNRSERALRETSDKYKPLCMTVAYNILGSREDAEEIFSDALLHLWNAIPPAEPASVGAYLLTAVRNAARDRLSYQHAQRRGGALPLLLRPSPESVRRDGICISPTPQS